MMKIMHKHLAILALASFSLLFSSFGDELEILYEATINLSSGITLEMKMAPFEKEKHTITSCKILDWSGVCLIDGKPAFGSDWEIPAFQLVSAIVKINGAPIELDVSCMFNPWFSKPRDIDFSISNVEGGYIIHGEFSDAAGFYRAEWLIIANSSVRTKLERAEC